jgi:hypothetical protein
LHQLHDGKKHTQRQPDNGQERMREAGEGAARACAVQAAVALDLDAVAVGKQIPLVKAVLDMTMPLSAGGADNLRGEILLGNFVNAF